MTGDYRYGVYPTHKYFETRHEAVGFAAVHGRKYTYRRLSSIDTQPLPLQIEAFEVDG